MERVWLEVPRAVAQLGSALVWGTRGRGFESRQPDEFPVAVVDTKPSDGRGLEAEVRAPA